MIGACELPSEGISPVASSLSAAPAQPILVLYATGLTGHVHSVTVVELP